MAGGPHESVSNTGIREAGNIILYYPYRELDVNKNLPSFCYE